MKNRSEKMVKRTILRKVFEENLRMVGEYSAYHRKQKRMTVLMSIGSLILLTAAIAYILNYSRFHKNPFFQYRGSDQSDSPEIVQKLDVLTKTIKLPPSTPSQYNAFLNNARTPLSRIFGLKIKTIVIDPGHGGKDPGAIGQLGTKEKNITLDIARKLGKRLKKFPEYKIRLTRQTDQYLSLEQRIDFANKQKADLFISIHVNYIPSQPLNIIETYYFGPNADKATLLLVEKENKGAQYTLSDFKEIIQKIGSTLKIQESNLLAIHIQRSLMKNISRQNKNIESWGVRKAPFIVLLGVDIPSVLSEVTCLSNAIEEEKLKTESYREEIAQFLEEGISRYLDNNHNHEHRGGE